MPYFAENGKIRVRWERQEVGVDTTGGTPVESTADIAITPITITDFNPKVARVGRTVTSRDQDFPAVAHFNDVAFGNNEYTVAESVNADGTEIQVDVPEEAVDGQIKVRWTGPTIGTGSTPVVSSGSITIVPFTITDFEPKSAKRGEEITVTGTGFSAKLSNQVAFGNDNYARAHVVNSEGTKLIVRVPVNAVNGKVKLRTTPSTWLNLQMTLRLLECLFRLQTSSPRLFVMEH